MRDGCPRRRIQCAVVIMHDLYSQAPFGVFVQEAQVFFSGQPATNDCLGALLATTLGFWYFMVYPSEAVPHFLASPRCRHPPASDGKIASVSAGPLGLSRRRRVRADKKNAPPTVVSGGPEKPNRDTEEARPKTRIFAGDALS